MLHLLTTVYSLNLNANCFSTQNLAEGGQLTELQIVVGGTNTAGVYSSGGETLTGTVITQCNQGDSVQVQASDRGAQRWGTFFGMWVAGFSGTLLVLL